MQEQVSVPRESKVMCKINKEWGDTRIDPCMRNIVHLIDTVTKFKVLACCCGHGKYNQTIIIKDKNGDYVEIESSAEKPVLVIVPKGIASAHINPTNEIGRVLALADIAWKPNDNEMENITFDDYDWTKWI